jgi:hypothetical protein
MLGKRTPHQVTITEIDLSGVTAAVYPSHERGRAGQRRTLDARDVTPSKWDDNIGARKIETLLLRLLAANSTIRRVRVGDVVMSPTTADAMWCREHCDSLRVLVDRVGRNDATITIIITPEVRVIPRKLSRIGLAHWLLYTTIIMKTRGACHLLATILAGYSLEFASRTRGARVIPRWICRICLAAPEAGAITRRSCFLLCLTVTYSVRMHTSVPPKGISLASAAFIHLPLYTSL